MFAIIKTGGKQYCANKNSEIMVERLPGNAGEEVYFEEVLMLKSDKDLSIGAPIVPHAKVTGEILRQVRGDKLTVFKKRRRKNSRRCNGHRQDLTVVRIIDIHNDNNTKAKKAESKSADTKSKKETGLKLEKKSLAKKDQ